MLEFGIEELDIDANNTKLNVSTFFCVLFAISFMMMAILIFYFYNCKSKVVRLGVKYDYFPIPPDHVHKINGKKVYFILKKNKFY